MLKTRKRGEKMSKTNIDGEVKQKFTEIIFAPFITLWNMAKSTDEVEDDIALNPNSMDKLEAYLAKNQDEIDDEVNKYGNNIKRARQEMLNHTKVSKEQLEANKNKYQHAKNLISKEEQEEIESNKALGDDTKERG